MGSGFVRHTPSTSRDTCCTSSRLGAAGVKGERVRATTSATPLSTSRARDTAVAGQSRHLVRVRVRVRVRP